MKISLMSRKLLLTISAVIIVVTACNKDKFTTEPQVKITSISPGTVNQGDVIAIKGKYTDKEGDVDSVLIVRKRYNDTTVLTTDTFRYSIAAFGLPSKTTEADLLVQFSYGQISGSYVTLPSETNDTENTFGLVLGDTAMHRSNYAESKRILLKKP